MFSHVMLGANELPRMVRFYDAVLEPLGLERASEPADENPAGVIWQRPGRRWPQFAVHAPFDGNPASVGNGVQVSFAAPSPETVDILWRLALDNGGTDEGAPGLRPHYAADFYAAYCRDPEGNKLCFVHAGGLG